MPTIKLTEKTVAKLDAPDPSGKQMLYWCEELKGFGVLCSGTTRTKTYVAQRQLPNGLKRRITIASVGETKLAEAREKAGKLLLEMRERDPKASRQSNFTLRQVLDAYLAARSQLRPRSVEAYRDGVERHLKQWLDLPLGKISPDMVEQRHAAIAAEVKEAGRGSGHACANGVMRSLKALWNFAAERDPDLPKVNPVTRLKRVWFDVPRRRRLVKADCLPAFYDAVCRLPSAVARDYVLLLLFTGLRKTEAASLKWSDVDFGAKLMRVPAASTKGKRDLELNIAAAPFMHRLYAT